ncbi:MAG: amino acid ABC transporter permease, partial [Candidatus Competibacteraceae bacterium]|nr:amino acid ABC transporter permease [Candidatus Competibacteraceae bacterium]
IIIGTFIGLIGGLCLQYAIAPLRWLVRAYVDILRGIPVLVLILFTFYGLSLFNISIPAFGAGVVALAAFCGAHMSEVVRGAISSIPHAQTEAAKALGLGFWKRFRFVILPQATRRMLPPAINTAVEIVKSTTLLSVIGVVELLLATQQTIARNYLVIQFYLAACVLYLIINFTISQLGALVERRFAYIKY